MEFEYLAEIQGGIGPEVWDKGIDISASSFMDAAVQAYSKAQELGGVVTSLSQTDGDAVQAPRPQHDTRQVRDGR